MQNIHNERSEINKKSNLTKALINCIGTRNDITRMLSTAA